MKLLLVLLLLPLSVSADYTIDVFWHGHLEATVQYQLHDTEWTTINRWYDKHHAMYVNTDEFHFQISPTSEQMGWFLYGCVTDNELIIVGNNPRYCKATREDFEK